jgi:hypothetical protein
MIIIEMGSTARYCHVPGGCGWRGNFYPGRPLNLEKSLEILFCFER